MKRPNKKVVYSADIILYSESQDKYIDYLEAKIAEYEKPVHIKHRTREVTLNPQPPRP